MVREADSKGLQVTKKKSLTLEQRLLSAADRWDPLETGKVCREAVERLRHLEKALNDVVSPMAALKRYADLKGARLNRMAYEVANNLGFVQGIAKKGLSGESLDGN